MRRFFLNRKADVSGVSGTGHVAEGVQFSTGTMVVHWVSPYASTNIYPNAVALEHVHGHEGKTTIEWLD
jgi:hypothetical protein